MAVYKIGVIGDKDSVLGFMAVGFSVRTAENAEKARAELKRMASEDYAVIYITENYAQALAAEILSYRDKPVPAIICIPSKDGPTGYGMQSIKKSVEDAVGADILFKDE